MKLQRLKFVKGNAKLGKQVAILSLPAGYACPFAELCKSKADKVTGKVTDGPKTQFRCYAVAAEALFPKVRQSRWNNFELIKTAKTVKGMALLITRSIPKNISFVRFHQSGDFFSQAYFDAWLEVARNHPHITFYGYTKALPYLVARLSVIPSNFRVVASYGGSYDHLIKSFNLRSAVVVGINPNESPEAGALRLGLELDHDDSHVWNYEKSFAISLHGTQPAGSQAGKAWYQIKNFGKGGYKAEYLKSYAKSSKKGKNK